MRKILGLIFLPIIAIFAFYGCGNKDDIDSFKKLYEEVKQIYIVEGKNIFFSDESNPNTLSIAYNPEVMGAINIQNPNTIMQKRYRAFYYEQLMINSIYNVYEDLAEDFYLQMSSAEYKSKDVEELYGKLNDLKDCLTDFKYSYEIFIEQTTEGLSDVLDINIKNYTYELNKIVEKSFDFMYEFIDVYEKYCIKDIKEVNEKTLQYRIDKAYLDIAHVIYLENFNTFSISVVDSGVCDVSGIIGNNCEYNLLGDLGEIKTLSSNILVNLDQSSPQYLNASNIVNSFIYASDIFDQEYQHYINAYHDVYTSGNNAINRYNDYRFDLIGGGSIESFLNGLSATDRSKVNLLTNFIKECYNNLVERLNLIVE